MSDIDKNNNDLPRIEDLSEEEIYKMIQEDMENIEPPESLSPANIEKKLQGVTQQAASGSRRRWIYVAGLAACLALGVMTGIITYSLIKGGGADSSPAETVAEAPADPGSDAGQTTQGAPVTSYSGEGTESAELGYGEVCDIINNYNESMNNRDRDRGNDYIEYVEEAIPEEEAATETADEAPAADNAGDMSKGAETTGASNSDGASSDYSRTDEQVAGVEEGDIVKTNGKFIFTVERSTFGYTVHIIRPDGNNSQEIGSVEINSGTCAEMYIYKEKIITIGYDWGVIPGDINGNSNGNRVKTNIAFIDFSNPAEPKHIKTHTQSGYFNTSRISDGYLYTFTEDTYIGEKYDREEPRTFVPLLDDLPVAEDRLTRAGEEDTNNYMVMSSISIDSPMGFTDTLAVLGGGATYYMSTENIYIARPNNNFNGMGMRGFSYNNEPVTSINKFKYEKGHFLKGPNTSFRGMIQNSYYMHEFQGNFAFVYTTYDTDWTELNGLCVLDSNLSKLGELRNIAPGERIYASYYIDNMAYFVTYRNTDPVFAVDISDPKNPTLKSELKLPGFSSYLHSFGPDMLIGIGYGDASKDGDQWDNSAKISLFKIGEDYDITEISKLFTDQYDYHIADQNHKAIFVDEERGLIGLGLGNYQNWDEATGLERTRYVVYQLQGKKLVKVMDTYKDKDLGFFSMQEARGVRIGETFYVCEPSGVLKAYDISSDGKEWKESK